MAPGRRCARNISEATRERETFKYDSSLIRKTIRSSSADFTPPEHLVSCSDAALTAYVQLVVLRLNAQRALISLFDSQYQHVVTEATSSVPLTPCMASQDMDARELWLCGTAVPRSVGVCSKILIDGDLGTDLTVDGTSNSPTDLPVITIADMTADERTAGTLYCNGWPDNRFYAGVPIRTHRGIDIGFLCVLDDAPREGLDEISVRLMQDVSSLIMLRFEARRSAESYQRADRMVRGLGSFVEGQATIMTGWQEERNQSSHVPTGEGEPNQNQQQLRADQEHEEVPRLQEVQDPPASHLDDDPVAQEDAPRPAVHFHDHSQPTGLTTTVAAGTTKTPERGSHEAAPVSIDHVFARAANIVRESVEVEGVLFLDASIRSFGGLATAKAGPHHRSSSSSSSSSSEEEKAVSPPLQSSDDESPDDVMCDILGFSTSSASSVDGTAEQYSHTKVPQKLLSRLLRRYPQGKVFNFDDGGTIHTSDFSSDELLSLGAAESILSFMPELSATQPQQPPRQSKRQSAKRRFARQNEGKLISDMFTGARSVILVPVWDNQRERWFAGGFVYTKTPTRVFTVDGELSYLRAFASVIMSEVARVKAISVDRAKTDLLSSMSHELRSPLHGVVLGVELLQDTPLDAFQGDVLHSVETCGRTLLDTMDHLLDWSKINNFVKSSKQRSSRIEQSGSPRARRHSIEAGMMSITSDMDVAVLIEEVVESICAGFNFQQFSLAQLGGTKSPGQKQPEGLQRLDTMQAVENIFTGKNKAGILNIVLGDVVVGLDIDPEPSWIFRSQPGAIRRIVMNILGNSLKYTSKGFIKVSLAQSALLQKGSTRTVELTVVDSGQGISDDYLQNHLFTPFSQENSLAAGAGLGLSIVKRIATSLGGSLQVQSKVGQGTTVRVRLPLKATPTPPPGAAPESDYADEFDAQVTELQGLRVRLMSSQATLDRKESLNVRFSQQETFARICRDWLRLHIIESGQEKEMLPDFVLCDEVTMKHAFAARRGNASIPIVVVCSDTLVARRLATSPAFNSTKVGVVEFVTQPIGPRKLAKILLLSFRRCTSSHSGRVNSSTLSDGSDAGLMRGLNAVEGSQPGEDLASPKTPMGEIDRPASAQSEREDIPSAALSEEPEAGLELPIRPNAGASGPITPGPAQEERAGSPPKTAEFLLVDDNPVNMRMISHHMKKLGHAFETAADGKQAYDVVREGAGRFKCIFMDISMPVMDGFESTRLIRAFEREQQLPRSHVFALTGLASESAQQEAFACGIDLFLTKPVKLKELNRILEERNLGTSRV